MNTGFPQSLGQSYCWVLSPFLESQSDDQISLVLYAVEISTLSEKA